MITFSNDQLVPPELCRLLYQTVPREYHAPVVFFNQPHPLDPSLLGMCSFDYDRIDICLNPIFNGSIWHRNGSLSFTLWYQLLRACYHEFGHIATASHRRNVSTDAYARDFRAYRYVEDLAEGWGQRKLQEFRDQDPRIGQPANLTGYLGARLCRILRASNNGPDHDSRRGAIIEWRCRLTGGQLTPGHLLSVLNVKRYAYSKAYPLLRAVSYDLGIDYTDGAGRRHKLYYWGDVPVVASRLQRAGYLQRLSY